MTKLDIAISSIKYSLEVNEEELENFKKITKSLNKKTNELMMESGKISDRLLLFVLLLININKKDKVFINFEENIIKLLKKVAPLFNNKENLDSQLILSNIITENETINLKEEKNETINLKEEKKEIINNENIKNIIYENEKNNEETIKFIEEIIKFIGKLDENINKI